MQGLKPPSVCIKPQSIALPEYYPLILAVKCWTPKLANSKVCFHSDNMAVFHIFNGEASHCPKTTKFLSIYVLQCLQFNIAFYWQFMSKWGIIILLTLCHISRCISQFIWTYFKSGCKLHISCNFVHSLSHILQLCGQPFCLTILFWGNDLSAMEHTHHSIDRWAYVPDASILGFPFHPVTNSLAKSCSVPS